MIGEKNEKKTAPIYRKAEKGEQLKVWLPYLSSNEGLEFQL